LFGRVGRNQSNVARKEKEEKGEERREGRRGKRILIGNVIGSFAPGRRILTSICRGINN
jgi:hypothetical protein